MWSNDGLVISARKDRASPHRGQMRTCSGHRDIDSSGAAVNDSQSGTLAAVSFTGRGCGPVLRGGEAEREARRDTRRRPTLQLEFAPLRRRHEPCLVGRTRRARAVPGYNRRVPTRPSGASQSHRRRRSRLCMQRMLFGFRSELAMGWACARLKWQPRTQSRRTSGLHRDRPSS